MGITATADEHGLYAGAVDEDEDNEGIAALPPIHLQLSHRSFRPLPIRSLGVCINVHRYGSIHLQHCPKQLDRQL
jgi:hypothetical protein